MTEETTPIEEKRKTKKEKKQKNDGALGGTRTHDLFLRREALYPLSY